MAKVMGPPVQGQDFFYMWQSLLTVWLTTRDQGSEIAFQWILFSPFSLSKQTVYLHATEQLSYLKSAPLPKDSEFICNQSINQSLNGHNKL